MFILGISAFYHDSAACLLSDGEIIAAAQEERFTRKKHDKDFPINSIRYCLEEGGIDPSHIDRVIFYEKPFLKFERLLETYLAFAPRGFRSFATSMPLWIKDKLFQKNQLITALKTYLDEETDWNRRLLFSEHHLSHAASAFFPSPFEKAAVLTLDGVGEWTTSSLAVGSGNKITILKEIHFPHSLGLLYSAFTYYTGFKVNSGEYKVMGLAPYGQPRYVKQIVDHLVHVADDGSFKLDMSYFEFATGLTMTNAKFHTLFKGEPRKPESVITQREMDLAASIQQVTEEIVLKLARSIKKETNEKNLCLAGGVALNCVANGVLVKEKVFENIWIQPAAGDSGGALGAALSAWHIHFDGTRKSLPNEDAMKGSFLGPRPTPDSIESDLKQANAQYHKLNDNALIDEVVECLVNQKAVGWMQGRMEFGPRALGGRSILADPRSEHMQKQLNLKVKYRESFRPFAPSVLEEYASDWFDLDSNSPYMLIVANVSNEKHVKDTDLNENLFGIDLLNRKRSVIPSVTHIDYSARVQTVGSTTNPRYHELIKRFYDRTGCPILVNTSFNIRGEPIVCSSLDAFRCFMGTELDVLVIENFLLLKSEQIVEPIKNYVNSYELD